MSERQRTYQIPEEHRARVAELSTLSGRANVRHKLAGVKLQAALSDPATEYDAAVALYDEYKRLTGEATAAYNALWDVLKGLDAAIASAPSLWTLENDDMTMTYKMPQSGAALPKGLPRGAG